MLCASFKDVEHACQQCGTAVEDGRPFCPQCRAPQITVKVDVPDAVIAVGSNLAPNELSSEFTQTAYPDRLVLPVNTLDSRIAVRSAIKAGVLGVFIGAIPLIGMLLTGGLAVFFYRRRSGFILPAALGARLGGAAGLVVFVISALFAIAIIASHSQQQCIDLMMTTFQRFGANAADPEIEASIRNVFTPSGQAIALFVAVGFTSVGGALASLFLRFGSPRK
jgi:hypothetical protein